MPEDSLFNNVSESTLGSNISDVSFSDNMTATTEATNFGGGNGGGAPVRYFPWANPLNIMTQEASDEITETLQCYIFPIITLVGLAGNILSLIVLLQKNMRTSTTSIILTGLAISDAMFLVTNAVRKSTCIISRFDDLASDTLNATTFYFMFYLKTSFSRVSTVIVVLISIERLVAVAFPLKVKTWVTRPRMLVAVILSYIVTFGGLAALPPQYTYVYRGKKPYISLTPFAAENKKALEVYNEYFLPIAFRHIPVLIVLILNSTIIFLLGRSKRFHKQASKQDSKRSDEQKKITRMLLSVAIVFLICLLPGDILLISSLAVEGFQFYGTYHNLFMAISDICLMFEMLNSCINFVIYMFLNKNFNDTFMKLFCCCIRYVRSKEGGTISTKSRRTMETSASSKVKVGLNDLNFDSGVGDGGGPSVSADAEITGEVNKAYEE